MSLIPVHPQYSHKELISIINNYDTLIQLKKDYPELYTFIKIHHLQTVYASHMRKSNKAFDHEYLKQKCLKYKDQVELKIKDKRLYFYLVNRKLLSKYFPRPYFKHTKEKIIKLIKSCKTVAEFRRKYPGAYESAQNQGFLKEIIGNKPQNSYTYYTKKDILSIAKKYSTMTEFAAHESIAYIQAKKLNILSLIKKRLKPKIVVNKKLTIEDIAKIVRQYTDFYKFKKEHPFIVAKLYRLKRLDLLSHMRDKNKLNSISNLQKRARNYKTRSEFCSLDHAGYMMATRLGVLDKVCAHMIRKKKDKYTKNEVIKVAKEYSRRGDFLKANRKVYYQAKKLGIFDRCVAHMDLPDNNKMTPESKLYEIARKYKHRTDFYLKDRGAYEAARRRGILNKVCKHMVPALLRVKKAERDLLSFVKTLFPDAQNRWFYNLKIKNRPYIHAFELDVFIPSLNKAIELDGVYWHSKENLLKRRKKWPKSAKVNYHKIKDEVFLKYFDINILHISDIEWCKDRFNTKQKIVNFLTS